MLGRRVKDQVHILRLFNCGEYVLVFCLLLALLQFAIELLFFPDAA